MLEIQQRDCVRELGRRVQELAASEEYEARRRRWRDVNGLRKPDRPPVWCRPVGCWGELLPEADLKCADPFYRDIERALRRALIKHDIGDDSIVEPYWPVPAAVRLVGEHTWGVEIRHVQPADPGGAWRFDPPLKDEADLDRLVAPEYVHDRQATQRDLQRYGELFDGVMPVKVTGDPPLGPELGIIAAELLGLDNMMLNLAAQPTMMHRLFAFLRDGALKAMDQVERMGMLTENNNQPMYCSDSLSTSPGPPDAPVRIGDLWGQANSQEFQLVSPAMWREFLLEYQRPILQRYGLCSYGCCEDLTRKIDGVLSLRNLRIFVCSAWTDLGKVVEAVGDRYTIMWRQKATDVVYAEDLTGIRRHLEEGLRLSRGCPRQIVLRELQTLAGHPRRLHEWSAAAKEIGARYN